MRKWVLSGLSDEALMSAYARGQIEAFECLYLRHKQKLFSFLLRQCENRAIAEELSHDTWLAVIKGTANYQRKAKFCTWMFRIAHNRLVDYWRKRGNFMSGLVDEISDQIRFEADNTAHGIELNELLENLKLLPPDQIETLLLKIEGFSYAEIADITHAKQETVKSRLRYATQRLRKTVEVQI